MKVYIYYWWKELTYILQLKTSWYSYNQIPSEVKQDKENSIFIFFNVKQKYVF